MTAAPTTNESASGAKARQLRDLTEPRYDAFHDWIGPLSPLQEDIGHLPRLDADLVQCVLGHSRSAPSLHSRDI
jgi:hypothetical protein